MYVPKLFLNPLQSLEWKCEYNKYPTNVLKLPQRLICTIDSLKKAKFIQKIVNFILCLGQKITNFKILNIKLTWFFTRKNIILTKNTFKQRDDLSNFFQHFHALKFSVFQVPQYQKKCHNCHLMKIMLLLKIGLTSSSHPIKTIISAEMWFEERISVWKGKCLEILTCTVST